MAAELLAIASLLCAVPVPVRLPGNVSDAYALRTNPGGLAFVQGGELRLLYGRDIPEVGGATDGLGLFGAFSLFDVATLGGAFELDVVPSGQTRERTSLGIAFGGSRGGFGFAYEHFSPENGPGKNILSTGLELRIFEFLSTGIALRDLAQKAGRRTYDVGLSLRPFTDRLTLGARWRVTQGQPAFGDAQDFAFRADVEPFSGVFVGAGMNMLMNGNDTALGFTGSLGLAFDSLQVATGVEDTTGALAVTSELVFSSRSRPGFVPRRKVAVVELEGDLTRASSFNLLSMTIETTPYGALPLRLHALSKSDNAIGLYVRISSLSVGWAKVEELRNIILAFRSGGRRVDCELTGGGDLEYFLASACSSIIIAPAMNIDINGVAANVLFFADALDKLGIKVEAVARGRYKSAPEQFTRSGMSPSQREALDAYLDRVYATMVEGVSSSRKIDRAEVERLLAHGTMTATEAVAAKLVDSVLYPDQIDPHIDRLYGHAVSYAYSRSVDPEPRETWGSRPRIAIVHVESTISGGESRNLPLGIGQTAGSQTIVGALELVRLDPSIRAVVLRVDSPGGDAYASDLIARAVQLLDQQKPVIASFGDVAASGGYYVAAPARLILAEPTTLTGSIGVFSLKLSLEELLAKVGVNHEAIEKGPLSNVGSLYDEMSPEERAVMEKSVDQAYRQFLDVVAKGRKKAVEDVKKVAEGRIWNGEEAKRIGLVDELGGLLEALARARAAAGLSPDEAVEIVSLPQLRESLPIALASSVGSALGLVQAPAVEPWVRLVPHSVKQTVAAILDGGGELSGSRRPLALLPFGLDVD
jgi:protease IV